MREALVLIIIPATLTLVFFFWSHRNSKNQLAGINNNLRLLNAVLFRIMFILIFAIGILAILLRGTKA